MAEAAGFAIELQKIAAAVNRVAPLEWAASWDNVGLLWGDPQQHIGAVLVTNDCTPQVLHEAAERQCQLVLAYHPAWFEPLRRLASDSMASLAWRQGIALYSPHTAWDSAVGGSNDVLAATLGLEGCRVLVRPPPRPALKIVFFVPAAAADAVAAALEAAGAGRIGSYRGCQHRLAGTGIFTPEAGSEPTVGRVGQTASVPEVRIEMVVAAAELDAVVEALHAHHPYETPAFDLYPTQLPAPAGVGQGRVGALGSPLDWTAFVRHSKRALGLSAVLAAAPPGRADIGRVAVCAGAGAAVLPAAAAAGAQVLVTGEMRHHDVLAAQARGMGVICTLHSHSERLTLPALVNALGQQLPQLPILLSRRDEEPFVVA